MPQGDHIELHRKRHGYRLDHHERLRKREAREVHKRAAFAKKALGLKGKLFAKKRHAEKATMKKTIAMHQQRDQKRKVDEGAPKSAVPAYLLEREQVRPKKKKRGGERAGSAARPGGGCAPQPSQAGWTRTPGLARPSGPKPLLLPRACAWAGWRSLTGWRHGAPGAGDTPLTHARFFFCLHLFPLTPQVDRAKVLSNTVKQKRKEKAGKWEVPLPKVRPIAEDEAFKVMRTGKRKAKSWKRMVTKATFVGPTFTRKPPKYERFIRPTGLRMNKAHVTHPELKCTFCLNILSVKKNPSGATYTQLGVLTKGTVIEVDTSELGLVTPAGKVVTGKYAQITNNVENDGVVNAVLLV